ncbi:1916_t:CDS:10, partial [Cetraspora pellucida]
KERTANSAKGFGSLMVDDGGKESIAKLIADVKDEDALKLAQATQKHVNQKRNSFNSVEAVGQKSLTRTDAPQDHAFSPSETTLSNSSSCKQSLENKYHVIFKIINNKDVYNPLLVVKNRKVDVKNEGINDISSIPANKIKQSISKRKISGSESHQKTPNPWHVTHMEILKDYEQRNNISDISTPFKNSELQGVDNENNDSRNALSRVGSEPSASKRNLPYRRLSQIFIPPSQVKEEPSPPAEEGRRGGKHSRTLSLNGMPSPLTKDDHQSKSKKGLLSLFKRKDRKHNKRGRSDTEIDDNGDGQVRTIKELADHTPSSPKIILSSGDQSPRSSSEDVGPLSEKDFLSVSNNMNIYNSEIMYNDSVEHGVKYDNDMLGKPNRDTLIVLSDDASMYIASSNGSSARHSMEFDSIKNTSMEPYLSSESKQSIAEILHVEEHRKKVDTDENDDDEPEDYVDETVSVDLEVLPQSLRELYQKDNSRYVELNIRSNDDFKFNKFVRRKSRTEFELDNTLYDLRISLVGDASHTQRRINQQETSVLIARCDEYIEEATKLLERHKEIMSDRNEIIVKNNYRSSSQSQDPLNTEGYHTPIARVYELKKNIDEKTKSLNSSLVNIENTVNQLKTQHDSISEEMKTMFEKFEGMTLAVNHDYFHELKILEDNIHVLVSESGKSPWLDIFYLMMSYVLA